jgi:2-haloacid dehalogenase
MNRASEPGSEPLDGGKGAIEAVVFDLGGVLIDWNPRYLYRRLFGEDSRGMEHFLTRVCTPAWNERQDAGRSWEEAIVELTASHPEHAPMIRAYREQWEEMLGAPLTDTLVILEELRRAGTPLYALTNWSQYTFPYALERYPFLQWFADIVVSGREGVIKPDPAIFHVLLSRSGVQADRTVFVDDTLKNIEAAARLGFRTVHFANAAQLRRELLGLGLSLDAVGVGA